MTDKRIPRRNRDQLVPPAAVGVPKPIEQASEALRVAALAVQDAGTRRREAEEAARVAPKLDADAGIEAVQRGDDPPPATANKREAEAETARQRLKAATTIAERAAVDLERAIRAHGAEWLEPQRKDAAQRQSEALDLLDQLDTALAGLGESASIVVTLADPLYGQGKRIEHGRPFKRRLVGASELAALRQAVAGAVPELPRELSEDEQREADDLARTQRGWKQMARGGVMVPR